MIIQKKLMALLAVLLSVAVPQTDTQRMVQGRELCTPGVGSVELAFRANSTTGLFWYAEILDGESVVINQDASGYVSDPNLDLCDGVGGTQYYELDAIGSGKTLILFKYGAGEADDSGEIVLVKAVVDEDMQIHAYEMIQPEQ